MWNSNFSKVLTYSDMTVNTAIFDGATTNTCIVRRQVLTSSEPPNYYIRMKSTSKHFLVRWNGHIYHPCNVLTQSSRAKDVFIGASKFSSEDNHSASQVDFSQKLRKKASRRKSEIACKIPGADECEILWVLMIRFQVGL